MKIAFPAAHNQGAESQVYGHFGSAPYFIIADSENGALESVSNADQVHAHGQCQPLAALGGRTVQAVAVGGIGAGALHKLHAAGIRAFRAVEGTVAENLELLQSGLLPVFTPEQTCAGHRADGSCGH